MKCRNGSSSECWYSWETTFRRAALACRLAARKIPAPIVAWGIDLQKMCFGITANAHELRDARVPHFRLNNVDGSGVNASPGIENSPPLFTDRNRLTGMLGDVLQSLDVL